MFCYVFLDFLEGEVTLPAEYGAAPSRYETALHIAARLLTRAINSPDGAGSSERQQRQQRELMRILLNFGADATAQDVNGNLEKITDAKKTESTQKPAWRVAQYLAWLACRLQNEVILLLHCVWNPLERFNWFEELQTSSVVLKVYSHSFSYTSFDARFTSSLDSLGDTPLHYSARTGDAWGFCLLLQSVDDPKTALLTSNVSGEDVWSSINDSTLPLRIAAKTAPVMLRLKQQIRLFMAPGPSLG